jgi:hypothetical protein
VCYDENLYKWSAIKDYSVSKELIFFFPKSVHDLYYLRAESLDLEVPQLVLVPTCVLSISLCDYCRQYLSAVGNLPDDQLD